MKEFLIALRNWLFCQMYPFLYIEEDFRGYSTRDWRFVKRYAMTRWDEIPYGWRKAFGWSLLKDLKEVLLDSGELYHYRVTQVKEKWGALCWYDNADNEDVDNVIRYYSNLSEKTCILCGKHAEYYSAGEWICPYCEGCANEILNEYPNAKFRKI